MALKSQLPVGLLDVSWVSALLDRQRLVVVYEHGGRHDYLRRRVCVAVYSGGCMRRERVVSADINEFRNVYLSVQVCCRIRIKN